MKKHTGILLVVVALFSVLTGCSSDNSDSVSQTDLQKNTWTATVNGNKTDEIAFIFSFKDDGVTIKPKNKDVNIKQLENSDFSQSQANSITELAEDTIQNAELEANYKLNKDNLTLSNSNLELDANFKIEKDGDTLKLIPKDKSFGDKPIILRLQK